MPNHGNRFPLWIALVLVAGVPRILGAFFLPNAFGDAYVYARDAGTYSVKISSGTLALTDLYGFWLPLYQLICAVVSVFAGHPYVVAKVVSAVFGVGVCLLVYAITLRLTAHRTASLLVFAFVALSPLHIFNSASSMTDVPSAFFVVASLYFALKQRWNVAALFGALAGLTRIDNWMLMVLIPVLYFFEERRVPFFSIIILAFPPLFWFYVSWKATGDWLACFVVRKQYMDALLVANPSLASFSLFGVTRDTATLLISVDIAVLAACFVGGWLALKRLLASRGNDNSEPNRSIVAICVYFFAYLGFIVLAYLTHKQPIIFPRYGLTMFVLGLPMLGWAYLDVAKRKPLLARKLLIAIITVCVFEASIQLAGCIGFINKVNTIGSVAEYLYDHYQPNPGSHIFSDEGTVIALSGIPEENFLSSYDAPREREAFVSWLKDKKVEYLVFVEKEDSTPAKLFPDFKDGKGNEMFKPIMSAKARFLPTNVWVYRVRYPGD